MKNIHQYSNKQFIINAIQERDKAVHQSLLKLWRIGKIKKPLKPKTLILFPHKEYKKDFSYLHSHPQEVLAVHRGTSVIYLSPIYTNVVRVNGSKASYVV